MLWEEPSRWKAPTTSATVPRMASPRPRSVARVRARHRNEGASCRSPARARNLPDRPGRRAHGLRLRRRLRRPHQIVPTASTQASARAAPPAVRRGGRPAPHLRPRRAERADGGRLPRGPRRARSTCSRSDGRATRGCSRGSGTGSSARSKNDLVWYQLGGSGGPGTSALDVGAPAGTDVYAPVDGTVVAISDFVLANRVYGSRIDLRPSSAPSLVVSLTQLRPDPALVVGSMRGRGHLEGRHDRRPLAASSGRRSRATPRTRATTCRSRCIPPRRSRLP